MFALDENRQDRFISKGRKTKTIQTYMASSALPEPPGPSDMFLRIVGLKRDAWESTRVAREIQQSRRRFILKTLQAGRFITLPSEVRCSC